jgi:hypothetical protein
MPDNWRTLRRRGADRPKKESGTIGTGSLLDDRCRNVSSGNGSCIAAKTFSNEEPLTSLRWILSTRSRRSSAATMLSISSVELAMSSTMRGMGGQTSNVSRTGVLAVQQSRSWRRRGDPKTTLRHRRQTCTNDCHDSTSVFESCSSSAQKSNTSSRISSERMSIDIPWPTSHQVGQQSLRGGAQQKTHVDFAWLVSSHSGDDTFLSTSLPNGIEKNGGSAVREYGREI